jgi:hypothetical protein
MNRVLVRIALWMLAGGVIVGMPVGVAAQTGGDYALTWWSIDSGGTGASAASTYTLVGTAGQPDAGRLAASEYVLQGGFWPGGSAVLITNDVYLPLVLRAS